MQVVDKQNEQKEYWLKKLTQQRELRFGKVAAELSGTGVLHRTPYLYRLSKEGAKIIEEYTPNIISEYLGDPDLTKHKESAKEIIKSFCEGVKQHIRQKSAQLSIGDRNFTSAINEAEQDFIHSLNIERGKKERNMSDKNDVVVHGITINHPQIVTIAQTGNNTQNNNIQLLDYNQIYQLIQHLNVEESKKQEFVRDIQEIEEQVKKENPDDSRIKALLHKIWKWSKDNGVQIFLSLLPPIMERWNK